MPIIVTITNHVPTLLCTPFAFLPTVMSEKGLDFPKLEKKNSLNKYGRLNTIIKIK
jgi:hypothetical protein